MTRFDLPADLRVLVTAGASGLGRAMAEAFAQHGAKVHVCDLSLDALATLGSELPNVSTSHVDVSNLDEVERLFQDVRDRLGGLDVLINNAGIAGPTAAIQETSIQEWQRTIEVNLNGQFYCLRLAVPMLKNSPNACIINMSSVAGRLGYPLRSAYAASKWGVIGLTKSLAMELGEAGIRVNAILPGLVDGPRAREVIATRAQHLGRTAAEMEEAFVANTSLKRMIQEEDIASMALFLASSAGRNITGQALSVCGDVRMI